MKKQVIIFITLLLVLPFVFNGCNIFGWTGGESTDSLIDDGNKEMRDGNYEAALEKFAQAVAEDSLHSDALYFHAKATMYAANFNVLRLATMMSDADYFSDQDLPFMGPEWKADNSFEANNLYTSICIVYNDLNPIFYGKTHGTLDSNDIDLEYAIALAINGLLLFQDTNADGVINGADFNLDIIFDSINDDFEIDNFTEFVNNYSDKERQEFFEAIGSLITESGDIIISIIESKIDSTEGGFDTEEIEDLLDEIDEIIATYGG